MSDKMISEKEELILRGAIELLKRGESPYSIKVSDIAKAANVGKGTIYEYFESKEEVIAKSIIYSMELEIKKLESKLKSKKSFRERLESICENLIESIESEQSAFNMLLSAEGMGDFYPAGMSDFDGCSKMIVSINAIIDLVLKPGIEEGIISKENSLFYNRMAVKTVFITIGHYMLKTEFYPGITIEDVKADTYKLVMKALG
ncbi:TetR/AcrR family transcriptional regulator [Alkalibacter saccharofermentans]|uniref:Transcriptional regulator, TetR family n=1 Tax=Alkalibacter saccharofermentans DSM 14828 TaxID=1120975 RepID=A0A1M4VEW3_9FIRM|nr:TetR/AcrR family transcriptional regulator [Alkalibacter saccharofermentans]SHE67448.1 transcriptional regulator, TetR family [Alkalibacter saccharofermentans DSM 14828]